MLFKEFMEEWISTSTCAIWRQLGMQKPWYWDYFLDSLDIYHHMVYVSAYTYRATVWFNMVVPRPAERDWLRQKYTKYWDLLEPVWEQVSERWRQSGPGA